MRLTNCDSCGASIFFAATINGRDMPLDAKPIGKARVLKVNPDDAQKPIVKIVDNYQPHFVSCPNAAAHRSKTTPAPPAAAEEPTE